ncbi:MAG: hypothetical protein GXP59_06625 [Deltaproteobacteria bacterium]|nr:hypothetical protein [Deltaproteobacteria bacterium]
MKKRFVLAVVMWLIIITGIGYAFIVPGSRAGGIAAKSHSAATRKIINVNELAANPAAFRGNIILRGVVAGINKARGVFGIIDVREFKSCGTLSCGLYTLPVKYIGNPPKLKSFVNISGRLSKNNRGFVIETQSIQVVK